jgi:hypothetical protein
VLQTDANILMHYPEHSDRQSDQGRGFQEFDYRDHPEQHPIAAILHREITVLHQRLWTGPRIERRRCGHIYL